MHRFKEHKTEINTKSITRYNWRKLCQSGQRKFQDAMVFITKLKGNWRTFLCNHLHYHRELSGWLTLQKMNQIDILAIVSFLVTTSWRRLEWISWNSVSRSTTKNDFQLSEQFHCYINLVFFYKIKLITYRWDKIYLQPRLYGCFSA